MLPFNTNPHRPTRYHSIPCPCRNLTASGGMIRLGKSPPITCSVPLLCRHTHRQQWQHAGQHTWEHQRLMRSVKGTGSWRAATWARRQLSLAQNCSQLSEHSWQSALECAPSSAWWGQEMVLSQMRLGEANAGEWMENNSFGASSPYQYYPS